MAAFDTVEHLPTIKDPTFGCKDVMALCLTPTIVSSQWNVPPTHDLWQKLLDEASEAAGPVDFPQNKHELYLNLMHRVVEFETDIRSSILSVNQHQQKICKLAFAMKFKPRTSNELSHQFLVLKVLDLALLPERYRLEGHLDKDFRAHQPSYMERYIVSPGAKHYIERVKDWPTLVKDVINWNIEAKATEKMLRQSQTETGVPSDQPVTSRSEDLERKRQILGDMIKGVEGLDSGTKLRFVDSNLMWAALGLLGCSLVSAFLIKYIPDYRLIIHGKALSGWNYGQRTSYVRVFCLSA